MIVLVFSAIKFRGMITITQVKKGEEEVQRIFAALEEHFKQGFFGKKNFFLS